MRAAVEVIAEDGFEGASTRDMAARGRCLGRRAVPPLPVEARPAARVPRRGLRRHARPHRAPARRRRRSRGPARERRRHARVDAPARRLRPAGVDRRGARVHAASTRPTAPRSRCKRKALLDLVEGIVRDGIGRRRLRHRRAAREVARAIVSLSTSLVGVYPEIGPRLRRRHALVPAVRGQTSQVLRVRDRELDGAPRAASDAQSSPS